MKVEDANAELAQKLGLSDSEYKKIQDLLGREPNYTELGMFSAMWSEHCSYKNSKKLLRFLPATGENVFNAGMRGKKASLYEGGHRVPFFLRWPKPKIGGGRDIRGLTRAVDVLPTLIDLCGLRTDDGLSFDGLSLVLA